MRKYFAYATVFAVGVFVGKLYSENYYMRCVIDQMEVS